MALMMKPMVNIVVEYEMKLRKGEVERAEIKGICTADEGQEQGGEERNAVDH